MNKSVNEKDVITVIKSCVNSRKFGIPLHELNKDFECFYGCPIPHECFGFSSLKAYLLVIPNIYVVSDELNNDVVIVNSSKSSHIKKLVNRQSTPRKRQLDAPKDRFQNMKRFKMDCFSVFSDSLLPKVKKQFEIVESMLPLFYKHQAMGDDFFVDIADRKFGYYIPADGLKQCGLCICDQTIAELTERINNAQHLAPQAVVMIGTADLVRNANINDMIIDLRELVCSLLQRNVKVNLLTLITPAKMSESSSFMDNQFIFNKAILSYARDTKLKCNVIDMETAFNQRMKRQFANGKHVKKIATSDPYQFFTDFGKKIFLDTLRTHLKAQIDLHN